MTTFFIVVFAAIVFEYSNGFHDAANAIATVVSTRVLRPHWAVAWAAFVELAGLPCPLTPLENDLRLLGGAPEYSQDFIAHYLLALIYPAHLTRGIQWTLGIGVALLNVVLYAVWIRGRRRRAT